MGEDRIEATSNLCGGLRGRLTHASERELPRAEQRQAQVGTELLEIKSTKRFDQAGLQRFVAHAGERDQRFDGGLRSFFTQRAIRPARWRLLLNRHASGEADEAIGMAEVEPSCINNVSTQTVGVQGFQRAAEFGFGGGRCDFRRARAVGSRVGDAVQR
jgi:hypothetical protein